MNAKLSLLASVALLAAVPMAGAQEKKTEPRDDRRVRVFSQGDCEPNDGHTTCVFGRAGLDSALAKRAALGIQLSSTGSLRDTIGVFVARVTPKGPAENAGVVEGDRIVSINGVDLRLNAADAGDSYASGLASRRLTRELRKASPGSRVNLRVWSGGRIRDVQVTAGSAADLRERGSFGFMFDGVPWGMLRDMPNIRGESFDRLRIDDMPRFRIQEMPKVRIDGSERLREILPKVRIEREGDKVLHI